MTYTSIASAIIAILNTVTELSQVNSDPNSEITEYPCAILTTMGHEDRYLNYNSNDRKYIFMVTIMFRVEVGGTTEDVMRDVVSKVVQAIEAQVLLGGACDMLEPTKATWGWDNRDVPRRICEIEVAVRKRETR